MKYLAGLARTITQRGGQLFSDTAVESAMEEKDGVVVKTDRGTVRASDVVFATNSPIGGSVTIHTKQAPYRTYAFAATLPRGSLPDALYWDTLDPYHYVRLQPHSEHQDIVIVGGEDHKSGQADDGDARFAALEAWVRERLPKMGKVTHRWSGQVMEPADYIGFIGRNSGDKHRYIATGDSGQGITNGVRVFAPDLLRLLQSSRGPALALDGTVPCSVANLQVCCRSGLTSESFGPLNGIHARRFIAALIEAACLVKGSLGRSHILGGGPTGTFRLLSRRGSAADLALHVLCRSGTSLRGLIHSGGRRMLLPGVRVRL